MPNGERLLVGSGVQAFLDRLPQFPDAAIVPSDEPADFPVIAVCPRLIVALACLEFAAEPPSPDRPELLDTIFIAVQAGASAVGAMIQSEREVGGLVFQPTCQIITGSKDIVLVVLALLRHFKA